MVFTNSTNVIKWAGRVHSASAFMFECVEDSSNLVFLPFDLVLFDQPILVGIDKLKADGTILEQLLPSFDVAK